MSDRSFLRFGGIAGVLLAITSWAAVVEYYALVPATQQTPLTGQRALQAYRVSLGEGHIGLALFNGLYALIAFWAVVATIAAYFLLRRNGEVWAFFATLVGTFASGATVVASIGNIALVDALANGIVVVELPNAANPLGVVTFGMTSIWFLVAGALMWRGGFPRLLALLAFVAFADLAIGFTASLGGLGPVATVAAIIAGAVGGPIFWLWLGVLIWRRADSLPAG
jgi:hypothetical protein